MGEPSVLIVGAGVFGVSTAMHLAKSYKDPSKIKVIDRSPTPPEFAASIDTGGRIIQTDYPNKLYCNLAYEAIYSWFWDIHLGPFFNRPGCITIGEENSNLCERIRKVHEERGSHFLENVPLDKLGEQWDGAMKGVETKGLQDAQWNSDGGWVNAAGATASFMRGAEKLGVQRVTGEVKELILDNDTVTGVKTADGQKLTADKIVLATGAWTSSLLSPIEDSLGISEQDRVERQVQATGIVSAYFKIPEGEVERLSKMPVLTYGNEAVVIPPSVENPLLKFTNTKTFINTTKTSSGQTITAPAGRKQHNVPDQLKRETEDLVKSKVLPEFARDRKPDRWRICWDGRTPTNDLLMCKHPHKQLDSLYLAVGGSFHSYKFMPNAGSYMVKILNGESNGDEKDKAWGWKRESDTTEKADVQDRSAVRVQVTKREFADFEGGEKANL